MGRYESSSICLRENCVRAEWATLGSQNFHRDVKIGIHVANPLSRNFCWSGQYAHRNGSFVVKANSTEPVISHRARLLALTASASTYTSPPMSRNFFDIAAMPAPLSFSV